MVEGGSLGLPLAVRRTCIGLLFYNLDLAILEIIGIPPAVYHSDNKAVLVKISKSPDWKKNDYLADSFHTFLSNCRVRHESVKPSFHNPHVETATGPADEEVEVYRGEDKIQEDFPYAAVPSKDDDERDDDDC